MRIVLVTTHTQSNFGKKYYKKIVKSVILTTPAVLHRLVYPSLQIRVLLTAILSFHMHLVYVMVYAI